MTGAATYELVLLRHGESEWNAKNPFTGWVDVDLNDKGRGEAVHGGELLRVERVPQRDLIFAAALVMDDAIHILSR